MRKIIFLDIDGVIATPKCINQDAGTWSLCNENQVNLGKILEKTNAEIVLSSSWRLHTVEDTKKHMEENGFWYTDKITGVTIRAYHYIKKEEKIHLSIPRGVEIQQWIDTNIHSDNGKNWERKKLGVDYNYVILDDESDMLYNQRNNFTHTSSNVGLTLQDSLSAINILNKYD